MSKHVTLINVGHKIIKHPALVGLWRNQSLLIMDNSLKVFEIFHDGYNQWRHIWFVDSIHYIDLEEKFPTIALKLKNSFDANDPISLQKINDHYAIVTLDSSGDVMNLIFIKEKKQIQLNASNVDCLNWKNVSQRLFVSYISNGNDILMWQISNDNMTNHAQLFTIKMDFSRQIIEPKCMVKDYYNCDGFIQLDKICDNSTAPFPIIESIYIDERNYFILFSLEKNLVLSFPVDGGSIQNISIQNYIQIPKFDEIKCNYEKKSFFTIFNIFLRIFLDIFLITILLLVIIINFLIFFKLRQDHAERKAIKSSERPVDIAQLSLAAAAAATIGSVPMADNELSNKLNNELNTEKEKSLSMTKSFVPANQSDQLINPTNSASFVTLYNKSSDLDPNNKS